MLAEVAGSKGTEWMVSNYNAWQKRSPLPASTTTDTFADSRMLNLVIQKARVLNSAFSLSFRSVLLAVGMILTARGR